MPDYLTLLGEMLDQRIGFVSNDNKFNFQIRWTCAVINDPRYSRCYPAPNSCVLIFFIHFDASQFNGDGFNDRRTNECVPGNIFDDKKPKTMKRLFGTEILSEVYD